MSQKTFLNLFGVIIHNPTQRVRFAPAQKILERDVRQRKGAEGCRRWRHTGLNKSWIRASHPVPPPLQGTPRTKLRPAPTFFLSHPPPETFLFWTMASRLNLFLLAEGLSVGGDPRSLSRLSPHPTIFVKKGGVDP